MTEFAWHPFPSSSFGTLFRPIVSARLIGPARWRNFEFLVDSGADITSIPFDAGQLLGYQLHPDDLVYSLSGIGGRVGYVIRRVEFVLAGKQFHARVAWTLSRKTPYVLGQLDVFEHFKIELNRREGKFANLQICRFANFLRLGISLTSKFFLRPNSRSFPSGLRIFPDGCDRDEGKFANLQICRFANFLRSRRGGLSVDFKDSLDQMKVSVRVELSDHIVRDRFECFLSTHKFYRCLLTHKGSLNSIQIMFYAWQRPRSASEKWEFSTYGKHEPLLNGFLKFHAN